MALSDHLQTKDWTYNSTSRVAQRRNEIALYTLIGSLSMFFAAAWLGYVLILMQRGGKPVHVALPHIFWLSTLFALSGGTTLWRALRAIRKEQQQRFRRLMLVSFLFGLGFCTAQSFGLWSVLQGHFQQADTKSPLNGLIFVIILMHALHFLIGFPALMLTTYRAFRGRYDHEYHAGVKLCMIYWRFLDVVWVVLYGTFLLTT